MFLAGVKSISLVIELRVDPAQCWAGSDPQITTAAGAGKYCLEVSDGQSPTGTPDVGAKPFAAAQSLAEVR
jgi:hypothetical protein